LSCGKDYYPAPHRQLVGSATLPQGEGCYFKSRAFATTGPQGEGCYFKSRAFATTGPQGEGC